MKNEAQLVIEVWDSVRDFIPAKKRVEVAVSIFKSMENFGMEPSDFRDIEYEEGEEFDHLKKAFKELYAADLYDEYDDESYYDED